MSNNTHLLETRNLTKSYNGRKVVDDVNITVHRREVVGLLGPNGAGKTTTFSMIVGIVLPDKGSIIFDGDNIEGLPIHKKSRRGISYLSQEPSIFRRLTVEENIMAILETRRYSRQERRRRLAELLEELDLSALAKNKAYTLSGGEKRRLEITRALVTEPLFILLDEPFSGIDPIAVDEFQKIIRELKAKGLGVLLTDHNVRETLEITDRAYIMAEGKVLISGRAEDLIDDRQAREIYLGEKFRM